MLSLALRALAAAFIIGTSVITALPTDNNPLARSPAFHNDPAKDSAAAPLPHGWYGHDATTPSERASRLQARDAAASAAANILVAYRPLGVRAKRINNDAYEYDSNGHVITSRDYPEGFDKGANKVTARRFSDAGAEPATSWFPSLRERKAAWDGKVREAMEKRDMVRAADPLACAEHNYKCRRESEAREMGDVMAGRKARR